MAVRRQRIYHKRDRLRQLRAFCHAARFESISRSAEHLALTQPAVSLQVRELERELQAVLFERIGSRDALTPAGKRLYQLAMPLVETMDGLPDTLVGELGDSILGELRIAAGPGAVAFVLPRYIRRFRDQNPRVRLIVSTHRVGDALKLLSANEVDLAVGAERFGSEDSVYYPAFSYELVLITALDHPLAGRQSVEPHEAAGYPAVVPHVGTYARKFGEALARQLGVELNIAVETRGWGVLQSYVEVGLGISVVPDFCVRESARLSVIPLREYTEPQSFGFFARRGHRLPPAAARLIEIVDPNLLSTSRRPIRTDEV